MSGLSEAIGGEIDCISAVLGRDDCGGRLVVSDLEGCGNQLKQPGKDQNAERTNKKPVCTLYLRRDQILIVSIALGRVLVVKTRV